MKSSSGWRAPIAAALSRLDAVDERLRQIVELRFFGGFGEREIAELLGVTPRTIERNWLKARLFLLRELDPAGRQGTGDAEIGTKRCVRNPPFPVPRHRALTMESEYWARVERIIDVALESDPSNWPHVSIWLPNALASAFVRRGSRCVRRKHTDDFVEARIKPRNG